jgi:argonaute-like protein implicated in RNA metabolism and viral defense
MISFESLIDYYLGAILIIVINSILEKYNLLDWVLLIITNNIYNNSTLIKELNSYINKAIEKRFLNSNIIYILCLIYII